LRKFLLSALIAWPISAGQPSPEKWYEADYVVANCKGQIEFALSDGTSVDCVTATHAIEFDYDKKWAEALGQALFYSAMTGKRAGIVLIISPSTKSRYLNRLDLAIESHKLEVDVFTVERRKTGTD